MSQTAVVGLLFFLVWLLLAVPAGVFLVLSYVRVKMSGLLWLLAALVIWPVVDHIVSIMLPVIGARYGWSFDRAVNPYVVLSLGTDFVGGVLLLVAVIVLYQDLRRIASPSVSIAPPLPMQPPVAGTLGS